MDYMRFIAWTLRGMAAPLHVEHHPIPAGHASGGDALSKLAQTVGPRVVPAVLTGTDGEANATALRDAAGDPIDVALDMLGRAASTATTLTTVKGLKRGGRLVLMGSANAPLELSFGEMLANNWEVVGNFMYSKTAPASLAALASSGLLDLWPVRLKRFALPKLPEAIAAATSMRDLDLVSVEPGLDDVARG